MGCYASKTEEEIKEMKLKQAFLDIAGDDIQKDKISILEIIYASKLGYLYRKKCF